MYPINIYSKRCHERSKNITQTNRESKKLVMEKFWMSQPLHGDRANDLEMYSLYMYLNIVMIV